MNVPYSTTSSLRENLHQLGLEPGDGVFVHASLGSIGQVVGGARTAVTALIQAVGEQGLIAMPGFTEDAYLPRFIDPQSVSDDELRHAEAAVPGFDPATSPATGMGAIAETFRTWPETLRSSHPCVSVLLRGGDAGDYLEPHSLAWATGPDTPLGHLRHRPNMKMLLLGVGWNRCTALHTAETLAEHRRFKTRRFKADPNSQTMIETPDVADDMDRLFPKVGEAFEASGAVRTGRVGEAQARLCDYAGLVAFATDWIDAANRASGDRA